MTAANPRTKTAPVKKSRYAALRDQARAKHKVSEPYMFDGCEPPVAITAPDTIERTTAMADLLDNDGYFEARKVKALFKTVCGDAFDTVWGVIKDEPAELLLDIISDINEHFNGVPAEGDDLPGGE